MCWPGERLPCIEPVVAQQAYSGATHRGQTGKSTRYQSNVILLQLQQSKGADGNSLLKEVGRELS
jgi:hypothetical protein